LHDLCHGASQTLLFKKGVLALVCIIHIYTHAYVRYKHVRVSRERRPSSSWVTYVSWSVADIAVQKEDVFALVCMIYISICVVYIYVCVGKGRRAVPARLRGRGVSQTSLFKKRVYLRSYLYDI